MAKIKYQSKRFSPKSLAMIANANAIIANMRQQGYNLTLRQLYYQFVTKNLIPNKDTEYKNLGNIINDARLAGLIDWDAIVDRTRFVRSISHQTSPEEAVKKLASRYYLNMWDDQPKRIEVWIEKDALVGVIERVCNNNDVPYFACRGYVSQSEVWGAAQRIGRYIEDNDQDVVILHLGDHDPSGIDMSRDIEDRLKMFLRTDWYKSDEGETVVAEFFDTMWEEEYGKYQDDYDRWDPTGWKKNARDDLAQYVQDFHYDWSQRLEIRRIALNMNQIRQYNPPPNPAKLTDSRAQDYIAIHGNQSWELDALSPAVINQLIQDELDRERDDAAWQATTDREEEAQRLLKVVAEQWGSLTNGL